MADYIYTFEGAPIGDGSIVLDLTVSDTLTDADGNGEGYAITAISGSVGGEAVSAEYGLGGDGVDENGYNYDNTLYPSDSDGVFGSSYGIDEGGIDFVLADGTDVNIFSLEVLLTLTATISMA